MRARTTRRTVDAWAAGIIIETTAYLPTVGHGACLFGASQRVDLAAIRQNPATKLALVPHPPDLPPFTTAFFLS